MILYITVPSINIQYNTINTHIAKLTNVCTLIYSAHSLLLINEICIILFDTLMLCYPYTHICITLFTTHFTVRARLVDYLFPMSRPTLFLGPTLKKNIFFFTFRPTLSRGAFFSSENCILNEINKIKKSTVYIF